VTVTTGGVITGFNFVPGAAATMTSPTSVPLHLLALERAAQPGTLGDLAVGGDSAAKVTSDTQLRAAIVNVAGYYLRLAKTRTPAQMEALIWDKVSSDGVDHGQSCAAFASLTLELAAQAVGQQSWVSGGETYPWPEPAWADPRVDTNPDSPGITSVVADAQAHGRWHPLGDGYQPRPGDWTVYDEHVEVVTSYAGGVLDTIGADSLPGLTVNAHSSAAPLAEQGVAGFVDNGNLSPAAGSIGSPASAASQAPAAPAARQPAAGKSASGKPAPPAQAPRASAAAPPASGTGTSVPAGAATIPGVPAASASPGSAGSHGSATSDGSGASHGAGHAGGTGAGAAVSAAVPGVLAAGDLLGRVGTGTASGSGSGSAASGSGGGDGAGAGSGQPDVAARPSAAATIPGLSATPTTAPAAGQPAAVPGAQPAHAASPSSPAATPSSPAATPSSPAAAPTAPAASPAASPGGSAGRRYATPGTRDQQAFISMVAPGAMAAQQRLGVPAAVTIAQAIEESAWGSSGLSAQYHNLFGIKGAGPAGSVSLPTSEFQGGQWVTIDAPFRVYHNDAESIADHAELLATSGYYTRAMADRAVPDAFANDLTGVYATDPNYGANLIALMKLYNLYQFDSAGGPTPATPPATAAPATTPAPVVTPSVSPSAQQAVPSRPAETGHPAPSPTPTAAATATGQPAATPTGSATAAPTGSPTPTPTGHQGAGYEGSVHQGSGHASVPGVAAPALAPSAPAVTSVSGGQAPAGTAATGRIPGLVSPGPLAPATTSSGTGGAVPARGAPARGTTTRGTSAPGTSAQGVSGQGVSGRQGTSARATANIPGVAVPGVGGGPGPAVTPGRAAGRGASPGVTASRRGALAPGVATSNGIVTTARVTRTAARGPARYQAQLPPTVTTALFASAKAPLSRSEHLYRDVAACTGISWELLATVDWMQCKADPRYSPVHGEKIGSLNDDGTSYPSKSAALIQCACDLIELAAAVYGVDLTARRRLSVRELASAFAAFRWGALLRRHGVSAMEFPYSVAGLTVAHQKMHWPSIDAPDAPDRPGARFREPFGAVPVALSLDYPATVLRQKEQGSPCSAS
jgi:flagellum-specific peptidoglycan hydrolase FlgJ